jgi:energy-coupling factor transporter ATP-binding protein EcfA2
VVACVLATNREFTSQGGGAAALWEEERNSGKPYALFLVRKSMEEWIGGLRRFARSYGAFDGEIERGINILLGGVFSKVGEQTFDSSVFKEDLVEAFTGSREARPLATADVCSHESTLGRLSTFANTLNIQQWDSNPIRRDVLEDLFRGVQERALVAIVGPGGCGKSTLLWHLFQLLQDKGRSCHTLLSASEMPTSWIPRQVNQWRNLPISSGLEDAQSAVERLKIANPDARPILHLGLDGLDEQLRLAEREVQVRELMGWFWRQDRDRSNEHPPDVTLLVTCREREELINRWLILPPDHHGETPHTIDVGNFSDSEFEEAIRRNFTDLASGDTISADIIDFTQDRYHPPVESGETYLGRPLSNSIAAETLLHPVMWRALLELDPDERERFLAGDNNAMHALAEKFIELFCWKLRLRVNWLPQRAKEVVVGVLGEIAERSIENGSNSMEDRWIDTACRSNRLNRLQASDLYREATSFGLISLDKSPSSWRWRHSIIYRYLARGAGATHA